VSQNYAPLRRQTVPLPNPAVLKEQLDVPEVDNPKNDLFLYHENYLYLELVQLYYLELVQL
jgi:hypothetical protein